MKKLSLLIILIISFGCKENSTSPINTYSWKLSSMLPKGGTYLDIFFINANKGWITGLQSEIFHSQNAGVSWELQRSSTSNNPLQFVHFIDEQYGWAMGYGTAYYTVDGGKLWRYVNLVGYGAHVYPITEKIFFVDRENILVFWQLYGGNRSINVSRYNFNADSSIFKRSGTHEFTDRYSAITHLQNKIWVADVSNNIYISTDGGINWTTQNIAGSLTGGIKDMYFTNEQNGWFCSDSSIYYSGDGGNNWQYKSSVSDSSLKKLCFFNNEGWLMGEKVIYHSTDRGETWKEQFKVEADEKLVSISFINNTSGWALSEAGNVYHYGIE